MYTKKRGNSTKMYKNRGGKGGDGEPFSKGFPALRGYGEQFIARLPDQSHIFQGHIFLDNRWQAPYNFAYKKPGYFQ